VHADLIRRIRELGVGKKWVFQSRAGTPINSDNFRRRFLHPAAAVVGVKIGGWRDFRHTLTSMMRRAGVNAVVVSGTLGHKEGGTGSRGVRPGQQHRHRAGAQRRRQTVATNCATKSVRELKKCGNVGKMVGPLGFEPRTNRL